MKVSAITDFISLSTIDFFKSLTYSYLVKARYLKTDKIHLEAAVHWLLKSIDVVHGNGSSKAYRFSQGWMPAYPETSGYIIETLLNLFILYEDEKYLVMAKGIGDWELSIQLEDGGFTGRELGVMQRAIVFNTGMVLLGLNSLYEKTREIKYLDAGINAGKFLIDCQDEQGCFIRNTHNNIIHTYNVRSAWGLIQLGVLAGRKEFIDAGRKNVDWAISQQLKNGYFLHNNFRANQKALTHSIGYVMRGFIESYLLTNERKYLDAVIKTADKIISIYGIQKKLVSEMDEEWKAVSSYICLTGYAQIALDLLKLFKICGDLRYLNTALHLIDDVKIHQPIKNSTKAYYGAIAGSFPIYGRYAPLQFPNWATKFFIDALLLKSEIMRDYENSLTNKLSFSR